jgi:hypothetical protein
MAFEICEAPQPKDLAISNPADDLNVHLAALEAQHRYWSRREIEATDDVELGKHALAHGLHDEIRAITTGHIARLFGAGSSEHIRERDRRRALGTLATSLLMRIILRHDPTLHDAVGLGYSTMVLDFMPDDNDMPLDHRLHMVRAAADQLLSAEGSPTDQWYRQGRLYVRRTFPAQPSDPIIGFLQQRKVTADFDTMATLFPYVASRR